MRVTPRALGVTLLGEKSPLNRAREDRPVQRQNLLRHNSGLVWKLTVNPRLPHLSWLNREFALNHESGVVLVNPDDEPGHCNLTQKEPAMTAQD